VSGFLAVFCTGAAWGGTHLARRWWRGVREHRYQDCGRARCARPLCRAYRDGYGDGYGAGYAAASELLFPLAARRDLTGADLRK
jgi:hypothetical protein